MPLRLIESLTTTEPLAEIFSDSSVLAAMLDFEVALARAEARLKIIPSDAAETIAACARPAEFDAASLTRAARLVGTPAIPVVDALIEAAHAYGLKKPILEDQERNPLTYTDVIRAAFALSAVLAGAAGFLIAPLFNVNADMGTVFGLKAFAVAIERAAGLT